MPKGKALRTCTIPDHGLVLVGQVIELPSADEKKFPSAKHFEILENEPKKSPGKGKNKEDALDL